MVVIDFNLLELELVLLDDVADSIFLCLQGHIDLMLLHDVALVLDDHILQFDVLVLEGVGFLPRLVELLYQVLTFLL